MEGVDNENATRMTPQYIYNKARRLSLPHFGHLYTLFDPKALPHRCKTGISIDGEIRCEQIQESIKFHTGRTLKFRKFYLPVLYARQNERFIHKVFSGFRNREFAGTDGHTEHFWAYNFLTFAAAWLGLWWFGAEAAMWKAGYLLFVRWPLDHILLIVLLAALQYALIFSVFYGLLFFLFA